MIVGSKDAIVLRVNVEANYAYALHQTVNVTQMFVKIVGLGNAIIFYMPLLNLILCFFHFLRSKSNNIRTLYE